MESALTKNWAPTSFIDSQDAFCRCVFCNGRWDCRYVCVAVSRQYTDLVDGWRDEDVFGWCLLSDVLRIGLVVLRVFHADGLGCTLMLGKPGSLTSNCRCVDMPCGSWRALSEPRQFRVWATRCLLSRVDCLNMHPTSTTSLPLSSPAILAVGSGLRPGYTQLRWQWQASPGDLILLVHIETLSFNTTDSTAHDLMEFELRTIKTQSATATWTAASPKRQRFCFLPLAVLPRRRGCPRS